MGKFVPIFNYKIDAALQELFEVRFEKSYQENRMFFEKFIGSVEVHFSDGFIPVIKFVGNFNQQESKLYQDEISLILAKLLNDTVPIK